MEDGQGHQEPDVRDPADQRGPSGQAETQQTQQPQQPQQLPFRPPNQQHPGHYFPPRQHFAGAPQPPYPPPQAPLHHGPYDMSAMPPSPANPDYRQHRHHHHQQQQQQQQPQQPQQPQAYGQTSGLPRGPVVQYSGHGEPGQPFFYPQQPQAQAAPYYDSTRPPGHVASPAPNTMPQQQHGYGYYPVQGPPPAPYYYPPKMPMYPQQMPMAYSPTRPVQPASLAGMASPKGPTSPQKGARRPSQGQSEAKAVSVARGPPMKPKQSGHAIWIGNLPPQTDLMSLVHHVCQKTDGLESLFLISKSNCAFANYEDEQKCLAAQQSINDTWFASVRLVARLRKNAAEGAPGAQGPRATAGEDGPADHEARRDSEASPDDGGGGGGGGGEGPVKAPTKTSTPTSIVVDGSSTKDAGGEPSRAVTPASGDRFFILKSLTVDDLERSVQTGLWATQAHNEETLNSAFKSCRNVYLFFSANKSGEYFGYARMLSETNPDPAAAIEFAPRTQVLSEADLPKAIPTEATEFAPRGRIVDDAARGTAFWEAVRDDDEPSAAPAAADDGSGKAPAAVVVGDDNANADADADAGADDAQTQAQGTGGDGAGGGGEGDTDTAAGTAADDDPASSSTATTTTRPGTEKQQRAAGPAGAAANNDDDDRAWGRPFRLAWLSTTRLPFYRTRGMRNPLNANREIKIARDGTEVDAAVGRRLIGLFHEAAAAAAAAAGSSPDGSVAAGRSGSRSFGLGVPPSPY